MSRVPFSTERHLDQVNGWPQRGRHILAAFDSENITVYQAYGPEIGKFAVREQYFGGAFSFSRMSWIKPNFLWMMYRSGWGTKEGQEVTLAVTIRRSLFDEILALAVPSTFQTDHFEDHDSWKRAVAGSEVRLQWDPDHDPNGRALERRAIQLGLRGGILERYARSELVRIDDVSDFVAEQREILRRSPGDLRTPTERVYCPSMKEAADRVGL